jgi:hypothetical protein
MNQPLRFQLEGTVPPKFVRDIASAFFLVIIFGMGSKYLNKRFRIVPVLAFMPSSFAGTSHQVMSSSVQAKDDDNAPTRIGHD